jgi:hypothetical protein
MDRTLKTFTLLLALCLVAVAEDPSWKSKPMQRWTPEEAWRILTDSPWAQRVTPQWTRDLSPDERRAGGDMQADMGKGVGLEGLIGIFDSAREEEAIAKAHAKPDPGTVLVRWESAPVRAAEGKVADSDAPEVDTTQYYAIVVYGIVTPKRWNIERELRGIAFLKRGGKKDIKPARVIIRRKDSDSAAVIYLFPRVEISKRESSVIFQAQVGRLVVTRIFSTRDMQLQDQLEL